MKPLTIKDIKDWLVANQSDYEKIIDQGFLPPLDNDTYWMYVHLSQVMVFYALTDKTHNAIQEFNEIENFDYTQIKAWTKKYEVLGSQELLQFEIEYFDWEDKVDEDLIKISEGIYMELAPFIETHLFCRLFQILFWKYNITTTDLSREEIENLQEDLKNVLISD